MDINSKMSPVHFDLITVLKCRCKQTANTPGSPHSFLRSDFTIKLVHQWVVLIALKLILNNPIRSEPQHHVGEKKVPSFGRLWTVCQHWQNDGRFFHHHYRKIQMHYWISNWRFVVILTSHCAVLSKVPHDRNLAQNWNDFHDDWTNISKWEYSSG